MRGGRTAFWIAVVCVVGGGGFFFWPGRPEPARPVAGASMSGGNTTAPLAPPRVAPGSDDAPSEIAADLNAPGGNIRRDLELVSELFVAWQSNFPRDGNPVGENAEITAALAGRNRLNYAFIPRNHRAINARGELCDRWGTPFRLHQVSGTHMEVRSAGPDKRFATPDDVQWPE